MSVSVVVPLYNGEQFIERAIRSVLVQIDVPEEIIVVDDGSTDSGPSKVESMADPRIKLLRQANAGPGAARNAGARIATSQYIAFLDADDIWATSFLHDASAALSEMPTAKFYFGSSRVTKPSFDQSDVVETPSTPELVLLDLHKSAKYLKRDIDRNMCAALCHRLEFLQLGGFYDREGCRFGEDSVISMLARWNGRHIHDDKVVHFYSRSPEGLTAQSKSNVRARPLSTDLSYVLDRLPDDAHVSARRLSAYVAAIDAMRLLRASKLKQSCALMRFSLKNNQFKKQNTTTYYLRFVLFMPFAALRKLWGA